MDSIHSGLTRNANRPATGTDCHGLVYWQGGFVPIGEPLAVSSGPPTLIKPRQGRRRPLGKCSSQAPPRKTKDHLGIQKPRFLVHHCTGLFGLYGPRSTRWNYACHGKLESLSLHSSSGRSSKIMIIAVKGSLWQVSTQCCFLSITSTTSDHLPLGSGWTRPLAVVALDAAPEVSKISISG